MNNYRKDIDGLRGISIILVLLFHLDLNAFEGGYIGVDIFFVISGYLITSIILNKFNKNKFNILEFYVSRLRRIFPVLFLVIFSSMIVSTFLFNSKEINDFSFSSISSLAFLSNHKYITDQLNYFTSNIEAPLLHTWSLSIEGQFYLFFPVLFIFLKKKFIFTIVSVGLVASFLLAQMGGNLSYNFPYLDSELSFFSPMSFSFYQTSARIWEILIGSILAFKIKDLKRLSKNNNFSLWGVFLLIISIIIFPGMGDMGHPGIYTLVPIIGTILILADNNQKTAIYKILANKYFVFIGLISYSLYLIHYPIISFYKIFHINSITYLDKILITALSIILSILSWKYLEKPFRNKKNISNLYVIKFFCVSCCFTIILFFFINNFITKSQYVNKFEKTYNFFMATDPMRNLCANGPKVNRKYTFKIIDSCIRGSKDIDPETILIGDSIAASLAFGLEELYTNNNKSFIQLTYNGCIPVQDKFIWGENSRFDCKNYYEEIFNILLTNKKIKNIIFLANFPTYFEGKSLLGKKLPSLKTYPNGIRRTRIIEEQMIGYINKISKLEKNIIIIKPILEPGFVVPKTLARAKKFNKNLNEFDSTSYKKYLTRTQSSVSFFNKAEQIRLVKIIDSADHLCDISINKCFWTINKKPIYHDDLHFSIYGSQFFANKNKNPLLFNFK